MIQSSPETRFIKKETVRKPTSEMAPISLVAWIPAIRTDREIEQSHEEIDRLMGSYIQTHPMYDPIALQKIGFEWSRRVVPYLVQKPLL